MPQLAIAVARPPPPSGAMRMWIYIRRALRTARPSNIGAHRSGSMRAYLLPAADREPSLHGSRRPLQIAVGMPLPQYILERSANSTPSPPAFRNFTRR